MNAERLHATVNSLQGEMAATLSGLTALREAVRESANDPTDPGAQGRVTEQRNQLYALLDSVQSEALSPAGHEALKELGVAGLLGSPLRKLVDEIFRRNGITPAVAADELDRLLTQVQELEVALTGLQTSFDRLRIGVETLEPGEVEVSFLIPRREVQDGLETLGREFINLKKILNPFLELSTGTREEVRVRAIASSEFETFLLLIPVAAAAFAKALETVLNIYEKVLNIRKAKKDLEKSGIESSYVEGLTTQADAVTRTEVEQFVDRLLKTSNQLSDADRTNELRTDLIKQTMELARRIDHGYRVDLQARELEPAAEDGGAPANDEARAAVDEVLAARDRLRTFKLTGKPILSLTESAGSGSGEAALATDEAPA